MAGDHHPDRSGAIDVTTDEPVDFLCPNGAGRSTTLRMLTTLFTPTHPDRGRGLASQGAEHYVEGMASYQQGRPEDARRSAPFDPPSGPPDSFRFGPQRPPRSRQWPRFDYLLEGVVERIATTVVLLPFAALSLLVTLAIAIPVGVLVGGLLTWLPVWGLGVSLAYVGIGAIAGGAGGIDGDGILWSIFAGGLWGWLLGNVVDTVVSTLVSRELEPWLPTAAGLFMAALVGWIVGVFVRSCYEAAEY